MTILGENDYIYKSLLPLYDSLKCMQIYEDIFSHSSALISQEDLVTIKLPEVFENMISLSFKSNKFILNDRTIENILH